jgi:hypothetical protein
MIEFWLWGTAILAVIALAALVISGWLIGEHRNETEARWLLLCWACLLFSWSWVVTIPLTFVLFCVLGIYNSIRGTVKAANIKELW